MAEHELKLKATIDTSQAQQQLNAIGKSAGGSVEVNTTKIEQAFSKLAQQLNKLTSEMEKASRNVQRAGNAARTGGNAGISPFLKGGGKAAIAYGLTTIGGAAAGYFEAAGNKETAKTINQVSGAAGNILGGAAAGAAMGSIIPGLGTGAGAIIGGAVGTVKTALDMLAENAKNAAEALVAIANFKTAMSNIANLNQQRNELKIAQAGQSEQRETLLSSATSKLKAAEDEANRLAEIAKKNEEVLKSRTDITENEKKALQGVIDAYKKAVDELNHNKKIVETINAAKKQEADKAKQEADKRAAEQKKLDEWKRTQGAANKRAQTELANEQFVESFGQMGDEDLKTNIENAKKSVEESKNKLADLLEKRRIAIERVMLIQQLVQLIRFSLLNIRLNQTKLFKNC